MDNTSVHANNIVPRLRNLNLKYDCEHPELIDWEKQTLMDKSFTSSMTYYFFPGFSNKLHTAIKCTHTLTICVTCSVQENQPVVFSKLSC